MSSLLLLVSSSSSSSSASASASAAAAAGILRCLKFDITVKYKPGKTIPVADALSRVCLKKTSPQQSDIHFIITNTSLISTERIKTAVMEDPTMNLLKDTIYEGWPEYRTQCPQELWNYWTFRCDLVLEDGLILEGDRIVIPKTLRKSVLDTIHTGHQGETKCILLARESAFWPGITSDIRNMVKECATCSKHQPAQGKLPLMQPDPPPPNTSVGENWH